MRYCYGKRFRMQRNIAMVLVSMVVLCFYFIYRFLFEGMYPEFVGGPLALIFVGVGTLFNGLVALVAKRIAETVYYEVLEEGLCYVAGKNRRFYRWKDFEKAELAQASSMSPVDVAFVVKGQKLHISQHIAGIFELTEQVLKRIPPDAPVDPQIRKRIDDMRGLYE